MATFVELPSKTWYLNTVTKLMLGTSVSHPSFISLPSPTVFCDTSSPTHTLSWNHCLCCQLRSDSAAWNKFQLQCDSAVCKWDQYSIPRCPNSEPSVFISFVGSSYATTFPEIDHKQLTGASWILFWYISTWSSHNSWLTFSSVKFCSIFCYSRKETYDIIWIDKKWHTHPKSILKLKCINTWIKGMKLTIANGKYHRAIHHGCSSMSYCDHSAISKFSLYSLLQNQVNFIVNSFYSLFGLFLYLPI